jgi:hypothetical protein
MFLPSIPYKRREPKRGKFVEVESIDVSAFGYTFNAHHMYVHGN